MPFQKEGSICMHTLYGVGLIYIDMCLTLVSRCLRDDGTQRCSVLGQA